MNNTQKTVLKVMVPVIIIIAAVGLASADNYGRPFELGSTGGIWVGAGILITGFIYKMSKDK